MKKIKLIIKKISNKKTSRILRKFILCSSFILNCIVIISSIHAASDPTLVVKINSGLKKIQAYLVKFATPAAGVAIASGVLMRKFSFGNEEKMNIGKKVIINAIIGYAIILSIDLIIKFVDSLV